MKNTSLLLVTTIVALLIATTSPATAHQSEYTFCAKKRTGELYAIGNGWRAACRLGDTMVQQREVTRTTTCDLDLTIPLVLCSCNEGEIATYNGISSSIPEDLVYDLSVADASLWLPDLQPPERYLFFLASSNSPIGQITMTYTCTSH